MLFSDSEQLPGNLRACLSIPKKTLSLFRYQSITMAVLNGITVEVEIQAPLQKVWDYFSLPEHITMWCQASPEWHAPAAENDLRVNGSFKTTMAAKDGSMQFDFEGIYTAVEVGKLQYYTLGDGRKVEVTFASSDNGVRVREVFEPETQNPHDMQAAGWQAILQSFKNYVETH